MASLKLVYRTVQLSKSTWSERGVSHLSNCLCRRRVLKAERECKRGLTNRVRAVKKGGPLASLDRSEDGRGAVPNAFLRETSAREVRHTSEGKKRSRKKGQSFFSSPPGNFLLNEESLYAIVEVHRST